MAGYTPYETWIDDMVHTAAHVMDLWLTHYEWAGEVAGNKQQVMDDIWHVFTRFRDVDPAAIEACVAELNDVAMTVASHVNMLADAHDKVQDNWKGTARDQFMEYMNAMETALTNIRDRVQALILVAQAELNLACDFQTDVNALVQKTLQGIEDAEIHQEKMALVIAGSIAAAGAALVAGPAAGPLVVGVLSAMTSGAASAAGEALDGDSVYDVVDSFIHAGYSLNGSLAGQGLGLIAGLGKVMELVTEDHLPEVRPDRPEVITAPSFDPRAFYPEGSDGSVTVSTKDLVPEPAKQGDQQSDHVGGEGKKDVTVFGEKVGEYDTGPARDLYPEQGPAA
jgi:uncharacterized protein YukE